MGGYTLAIAFYCRSHQFFSDAGYLRGRKYVFDDTEAVGI